jgi:hypothetical protein
MPKKSPMLPSSTSPPIASLMYIGSMGNLP